MKDAFFEQIALLIETYPELTPSERQTFDEAIDHLTAILYELLHPYQIEGAQDLFAVGDPRASGRVLH